MLISNENISLLHTTILVKSRCGKTSFPEGLHTGKGNFFKLNTYSLHFSSLILNKELAALY